MLHSIKYKIPAIVVKTRDEAISDRRQQIIDQVLSNPRLNANQKMRIFESAFYRKLVDEHKLDELPAAAKPTSYESLPDYEEAVPVPSLENLSNYENVERSLDSSPSYEAMDDSVLDKAMIEEDDTRTAIEDDSKTTVENDRRESIAYTFSTPKNEKKLKSGFIPVQGSSDLPGYMQPLKRDSLATSPVSSRLRENRPPPGHFTGKGRLRVVRW